MRNMASREAVACRGDAVWVDAAVGEDRAPWDGTPGLGEVTASAGTPICESAGTGDSDTPGGSAGEGDSSGLVGEVQFVEMAAAIGGIGNDAGIWDGWTSGDGAGDCGWASGSADNEVVWTTAVFPFPAAACGVIRSAGAVGACADGEAAAADADLGDGELVAGISSFAI